MINDPSRNFCARWRFNSGRNDDGLLEGNSMFGMGMPELLVILLIALLIFGAAKLPEIGRAFGKTINEFKKGMKEVAEEDKEKPGNEKKA